MERGFKLDEKKVSLAMADKNFTVATLAAVYGVSRVRMTNILNQRHITRVSLGRLASALGVSASEIIANE